MRLAYLVFGNRDWTPLVLVLAVPILFQVISYVQKRVSGWIGLQARYKSKKLGSKAFLASGQFGGVPFGHSMLVTPLESGIHLQWVRPFAFGTSPILLPWESLRTAKKDGLIPNTTLVLVVDGIDVELRMPREALETIPAERLPSKAAG